MTELTKSWVLLPIRNAVHNLRTEAEHYKDEGKGKPLETVAECHMNGIPQVFISVNISADAKAKYQ
jgi:hypothetical protein